MAFITIRALPGNVSKKGEIVSNRDDANFGLRARLPLVLRAEITGATATEVDQYLDRITSVVQYNTLINDPAGWRVRMQVDQKVIDATGMDTSFKQAIKDYVLNDPHDGNWTATQFAQSPTQLTVDIVKGQTYGLTQIKQDVNSFFNDALAETLHFQQFYYPDSVIDPRVVQGLIDEAANEDINGDLPVDWFHFSVTKSQAISALNDRLA